MNTIPTAKRLAGLLVLSLAALSLSSCGDDTAPLGATVVAPGDGTVEYIGPTVNFFDQTAGPLEFVVLDSNGNPLPGVKIRFFGGSQTVALAERGIPDPLTPSFTPLDSTDVTFFETTTDERGISPVDIYPTWFVPACDPVTPADIEINATVMATVGTASALWTMDITVTCT